MSFEYNDPRYIIQQDETIYLEKDKSRKKWGKLQAHCTSDSCKGMVAKHKAVSKFGVVKDVHRDALFCPDCSSALFWWYEGREGY